MMAALLVVACVSGALLEDLQAIDKELAQIEARLRTLTDQEQGLRREIADLNAQRASLAVREKESQDSLRHRLVRLYRLPPASHVMLLAKSDTLKDYINDQRILRMLATHDKTLAQNFRAQSSRLDELTQQLEEKNTRIATLSEELRQVRETTAKKRQARVELLASIAQDKSRSTQMLRETKVAKSFLKSVVSKMKPIEAKGGFAAYRGKLPWPAAGKVTTTFGQKVERSFGTTTSHAGIDIKVPHRARVQSVAAGEVVYSDWLKGYGQLVIVDHGDGYHSLVAHLAAREVVVGDRVESGTLLGYAGDTGSLRGTVVYFEIRKSGEPVNPILWLRS